MADDAISSTAADAWGAIAVEIPVLVMAFGLGARRGTGSRAAVRSFRSSGAAAVAAAAFYTRRRGTATS